MLDAPGQADQQTTRGILGRMLGGGPLILGARILARAAGMLSTIVLARVLAPRDFGLMIGAMVFFQLVALVTERALPRAMVHSRADRQRVADTAFVLISLVGFVLCGAIILLSPLIGAFFGSRLLPPVLVVLGLASIINTLGRVPVALLDKDLEYRRRAVPEIVASLLQAVVSIGLGVGSGGALGVFALAWGQVASAAGSSACGWLLAGYKPHWQFDRTVARGLASFTGDFTVVSVLVSLTRSIDVIIVGKFLGAEQTGFYGLAYRISHLPRDVLSASLNRILFPALASVQDQVGAQRTLHRYGTKLDAALTFPTIALLIVAAPDIVAVFLGEKWSPVIRPLQILAVSGLARSLITVDQTIILATGQRRQVYPAAGVALVLLALLLVPAVQFGIVGVAVVVAISLMVGLVISQVITSRLLAIPYLDLVKPLVRPAIAAVASAGAASWIFHSLFGALSLPLLVLMSAVMAVCYVAVLLAIDADARLILNQLRARRAAGARARTAGPDVAVVK